MTLKELESQLAGLSRAEKAEVLQMLVRDIANAWPGIEKTSGVAGGSACIVRTKTSPARSSGICGRWATTS